MWPITNLLPTRLQEHGFSLDEDEDFVALSHDGESLTRYTARVPYHVILDDAKQHLAQKHDIPDRLNLVDAR